MKPAIQLTLFVFLFFIGNANCFSQSLNESKNDPNVVYKDYTIHGKILANQNNAKLQRSFATFSTYEVDLQSLIQFAENVGNGGLLTLDLDNFQKIKLILSRTEILSKGYFELIKSEQGDIRSNQHLNVHTFQGAAEGVEGSQVAITISPDLSYFEFEFEGETYFMQPLWQFDPLQPQDRFIFYRSSDILETDEDSHIKCGTNELNNMKIINDLPETNPYCYYREVEVAILNEYSMYSYFGNNQNAVLAHNIAIMNAVQQDYTGPFNWMIQFKIVAQIVVTCPECNPVDENQGIFGIQFAFKQWANSGGFGVNYDLAHVRYYSEEGGAAGVTNQQACSGHAALREYTPILCRLQKHTSHEIGHNFTADHDGDAIFIMGSGSYCSHTFSDWTRKQINNGLAFNAPCVATLPCVFDNFPANEPASISYICSGETKCWDAQNWCIAHYYYSENDPNFTVTTNEGTICLSATGEPRIVKLTVQPLGKCGEYGPVVNWEIQIGNCYNHGDPDLSRSLNSIISSDEASQRFFFDYNNSFVTIYDKKQDANVKTIEIFDAKGTKILELKSYAPEVSFPTNALSSGFYIVRVLSGKELKSFKFFHY